MISRGIIEYSGSKAQGCYSLRKNGGCPIPAEPRQLEINK